MNEGSFFKFNKAEETPITPEEELSGELAAESAKFEANLEGLKNDVDELGGEAGLETALKKEPHILVSIAQRAALIAPFLVTINTVFSGSFAESIQEGNTVEIVKFVALLAGSSAMISSLVETFKLISTKPTAQN